MITIQLPNPSSILLVVELHPEEVLHVALGGVVDDVLVVEEGRVLGRLAGGAGAQGDLGLAQGGEGGGLRLGATHALGGVHPLGQLLDVVGLFALVPGGTKTMLNEDFLSGIFVGSLISVID